MRGREAVMVDVVELSERHAKAKADEAFEAAFAEIPEIVNCLSVSFLIAETKTAIALAPNLGDTTKERCQTSGIVRIPRSAIRRMDEL
jgi:hypothetical protein